MVAYGRRPKRNQRESAYVSRQRTWRTLPEPSSGGSSAGGNLALAACQQPACQYPSKTAVRASVTFYSPVGIVP